MATTSDVRAIQRARLTSVGLGALRPADDDGGLPGVVARLGAVQSQELHSSAWGVAQRLTTPATLTEVQAALADGSILRTHILRPTWHYVDPRRPRTPDDRDRAPGAQGDAVGGAATRLRPLAAPPPARGGRRGAGGRPADPQGDRRGARRGRGRAGRQLAPGPDHDARRARPARRERPDAGQAGHLPAAPGAEGLGRGRGAYPPGARVRAGARPVPRGGRRLVGHPHQDGGARRGGRRRADPPRAGRPDPLDRRRPAGARSRRNGPPAVGVRRALLPRLQGLARR